MNNPVNEQVMWSPGMSLESLEKHVILKAFRFYRGNKTTTAQALGISVRTLDNKLDKYTVDAKESKTNDDDERAKREHWLLRSRGIATPNNAVGTASAHPRLNAGNGTTEGERVPGSDARARVESAQGSSEKPNVSVSERKEVQGVLPKQASANGARRSS